MFCIFARLIVWGRISIWGEQLRQPKKQKANKGSREKGENGRKTSLNIVTITVIFTQHTHTHHTPAHTHAQLKRKIYTHFTPVALHFSFAHQNCQQKLLRRKLKLVTGRSNLQRGGGGGGVIPPVLCAREIPTGSASVACKQAENSLNSSNKFF